MEKKQIPFGSHEEYSSEDIIRKRLSRLQELKQVVMDSEGRYSISRKTLLLIGKFLDIFGQLLLGKNKIS